MSLFKRNRPSPLLNVLGTDMHCHLLPNVDDGSRDITETVSCLQTMAAAGFKKVYFTPHFQANYPNEEEDIHNRFQQLKKELAKYDGLPEIAGISGEYRFDAQYIRRPGIDNVTPLPGNLLLCEFSLHSQSKIPYDLFKGFQELQYTIVLAHPERYPYLGPYSPEIKKMKEFGILFQVNILSLNGFYGQVAMDKGYTYIENNWVEYLGTDMHNTNYAQELLRTLENRTFKKMLEKHTFRNNTL